MHEHEWLSERLDKGDDPGLWRVALEFILSEIEAGPDFLVEVGRCSHWLRPHQTRWKADGGFAWPTGYGGGEGGFSRWGLPEFDWSVVLGWNGVEWEVVERSSIRISLRIAIPSRTRRHRQAAVHTLWHNGREKDIRFYGFRKRGDQWVRTAPA